MPPWPFSSNSSAKARTSPSRAPQDALEAQPAAYAESPYSPETTARLAPSALSDDTFELPAPPFASSPPSHSRSHSRSLSNSLFGSGRRKAAAANHSPSRAGPAPPEAQLDGGSSPRKQGSRSRQEEAELEKGTCATCSSVMQWPRNVTEYRCVTCLMVNDLKPIDKVATDIGAHEGPSVSGAHSFTAKRARVFPVTLERTRAIIDSCVDSYLQTRRGRPGAAARRDQHNPPTRRPTASPAPQGRGRSSSPTTDRRAIPVNLTENRLMPPFQNSMEINNGFSGSPTKIDNHNMMSNVPTKPSRKPPSPPVSTSATSKPSISRKPVAKSLLPVEANTLDMAPAAEQRNSDTFKLDLDKAIFKPVEDYIAHFYANHECLNRSFFLVRPMPRTHYRSEDNLRTRGHPPDPADRAVFIDSPLSELDAKTLLLGDVAENGLWWTGKDTRANSVGRRNTKSKNIDSMDDLVNLRSPQINWHEVHSWYSAVIRAGVDWRHRRKDFSAESKDPMIDASSREEKDIDSAFAEARAHLQRTLLKAAETLLKRPGRPLKTPSDTRFLLILIANPLLYPASSSPSVLALAREFASLQQTFTSSEHKARGHENTRSSSSQASGAWFWEQGLAFGIIKRILGLLSNLPNTCHRSLTGWFARYDEVFFRQFFALIQGFVTHRLGRQHNRKQSNNQLTASDLIPSLTESGSGSSAQLHAALEHIDLGSKSKSSFEAKNLAPPYIDDWQLKAAARIMTLLFNANRNFQGKRQYTDAGPGSNQRTISRSNMKHHGQLLSTSDFYNLKADYINVAADFGAWESAKNKFSFCQFPFFLSVGVKIRIMELDVQRQMDVVAREAFFDTLFRNKSLEQYLVLRVRRECLIEDSLTAIDEAVAQGQRETKKALKVQFLDEPGVDAGGLRKEWFLLLVREVFDPLHGLFIYDEDSHLCYFNPYSFETSNQYFLVGALLGFAIYNLTILDVALPPFLFKKLLASSTTALGVSNSAVNRGHSHHSLDDLAEYRPVLARGLRRLLEYEGDVQETFCRDFVIEVSRYGSTESIPLCPNGENTPVTNANRQEFVDLYVRYLLDTQVTRQFEPFKRGFLQVCSGNALSLFQPEEIELLIRGSDEPLDVPMLKAVALYENWRIGEQKAEKPEDVDLIQWFWEFFEQSEPKDQRKLLGFITGSDRIPATGASDLVIKIGFAGEDYTRYPVARTCFNSLLLYHYRSKEELVHKLWRAVCDSEGFGLR